MAILILSILLDLFFHLKNALKVGIYRFLEHASPLTLSFFMSD